MTRAEKESAHRAVDEKIKCSGLVHHSNLQVIAGTDFIVTITFYNTFRQFVKLLPQECMFQVEITDSTDASRQRTVANAKIQRHLQDGIERFVCSGSNFQLSGQYRISFKALSADNSIQLSTTYQQAIKHICVVVLPSIPMNLTVANATLDVELGSKVDQFTVNVCDYYGNKCAQSDIKAFIWQLVSKDREDAVQQLRFSSTAADGSLVISDLKLPYLRLQNPAGSRFRYDLEGHLPTGCVKTNPVELKLLVKHGRPQSLSLSRDFPSEISNDSALPDLKAVVHDGQNVCTTAAGTAIALSDNLPYADLDWPDSPCLLGRLPLRQGRLHLKPGAIVASDLFKRWRAPQQKRQASHNAQPPGTMLLEGKLLLHSELGSFMEGDMVMMRHDEVSRAHPSLIPYNKPVLSRIERFLPSPSPQLIAAGRPREVSTTLEVTLFDPVYQAGDRVKAFAHGYPTQPYWDAMVVRRLDSGKYLIRWEVDAVQQGQVMPQTDLEKAAHELWRSDVREAESNRKVEARPSTQRLDVKQMESRAFVFHSSILQGALTMSPAILGKSVWFCEEESFPKTLQTQVDVFYGDFSGADPNWFDVLRSSSIILHARKRVSIRPSASPKYMELWQGDTRLNVSKNHFDRAAVPDKKLYARDSSLELTLRFFDESGTPCTCLPRIIREVSWLKTEDEEVLANDGTLPAYTVKMSSRLTIEALCVLGNSRGSERLKIEHEIKMQHGQPAKLRLEIVDEESREALREVAVSKQISLEASVLDCYDEVIPVADKDFQLQLRRIWVVDASSREHAIQSRIEDHRRGVQEWHDVKDGSSHAFKVDQDGISSRFKLPYSRLAGQAGAARVRMEAVLLASDKTYEISGELHLNLIAGVASKVKLVHNRFQSVDLGDTTTIFLHSGVAETGDLEVAITDDSGNIKNVPNGRVSLTLDGAQHAFQKDSDGPCYTLTLMAGPYACGQFVGHVSARAGAHTFVGPDICFKVEKSNSVEGIVLAVEREHVALSKPGTTLVHLTARFETEDNQSLPDDCIERCQLLWQAPGEIMKQGDLLPGWQFAYGHELKATAQVPWKEPGVSQFFLEYMESRPNVRKGKKQSNAVRVVLDPGVCFPPLTLQTPHMPLLARRLHISPCPSVCVRVRQAPLARSRSRPSRPC